MSGLVPAVPPSARMPGIEGVRAIAAVAVLVHHTWLFDGGERLGIHTGPGSFFLNLSLGVTLFFALSGFLLYRPFAAAIARGRALPGIRGYLRNRALRILPAYWVILAATSFVLMTAGTRDDGGPIVLGALTEPIALLKAVLLLQNYDPDTMIIGVGPAWSLAVEVVFYLVLPLLVLAVARVARGVPARSRRVGLLLIPPMVLLAVGISGKLMAGVVTPDLPSAGYSTNWHSVIERSFWAQADLFSFGMAAAVLYSEVVDGRIALPRWWRGAALGLAATIFLVCAMSLDQGQLSYRPENTAVALAAALFVAAVAFPALPEAPSRLQGLLEMRGVVTVGLISYSVFLWNEPVVLWLSKHGFTTGGWGGLALNMVLVTAVVGVLSLLTYRFVELPALRRKRRAAPMPAAQMEAAP